MSERLYVFNRFERFWHWAQAALILVLLATGFEIHGSLALLGFERAVSAHTVAAWSLAGLWVFALFWHVTTGEWRQYIPTTERILVMARFYASGIFRHEPHPYRPTRLAKHNPLQRITYLLVLTLLGPLIWVSGGLYLFYGQWPAWGLGALPLEWVATAHTAGAFLMLAFLVSHVYLVTTGPTIGAQLRAMVTGWDVVEPNQPTTREGASR